MFGWLTYVSPNVLREMFGFIIQHSKHIPGCVWPMTIQTYPWICLDWGYIWPFTPRWFNHYPFSAGFLHQFSSFVFHLVIMMIAVCKDSYVVYTSGFDRVGKLEWFAESMSYQHVITFFCKMMQPSPWCQCRHGRQQWNFVHAFNYQNDDLLWLLV